MQCTLFFHPDFNRRLRSFTESASDFAQRFVFRQSRIAYASILKTSPSKKSWLAGFTAGVELHHP